MEHGRTSSLRFAQRAADFVNLFGGQSIEERQRQRLTRDLLRDFQIVAWIREGRKERLQMQRSKISRAPDALLGQLSQHSVPIVQTNNVDKPTNASILNP